MILIMTGQFYSSGKPRICVKNLKSAKQWLKDNGFKKSSEKWQDGLYELTENEISIWARLDKIDYYEIKD